jgi:hypothetical protein
VYNGAKKTVQKVFFKKRVNNKPNQSKKCNNDQKSAKSGVKKTAETYQKRIKKQKLRITDSGSHPPCAKYCEPHFGPRAPKN